jgi:hypothetical protein
VDPFPLGGHILVGDEATLLLLVGGVRVDGEVLVVQFLQMLGGTTVGPILALPTRPMVSSITGYSRWRAVLESGWERHRQRVVREVGVSIWKLEQGIYKSISSHV